MNANSVLEARVRDWIASEGLCLAGAARRIGIAEMTLWRRLHGHREWRAEELLKLRELGIQLPSELSQDQEDEGILGMSEQKSIGEWREEALCMRLGVPTEIFFDGPMYDPKTARKVCASCPVCRECLEDQLQYEARGTAQSAGIFGGLTAIQRAPLRKKLQKAMRKTKEGARS